MAARQRFYEILTAASVPEADAVRVHVGLAALLSVCYRFDLALRGQSANGPGSRRKIDAGNPGMLPPTWLPEHLHYNHLFQHAPADLARQLELASAMAKAEKPELQVFSGYSRLALSREQLLELMMLMGQMYPRMMDGLRSFVPAPEEPDQVASYG